MSFGREIIFFVYCNYNCLVRRRGVLRIINYVRVFFNSRWNFGKKDG